MSTTTAAATVTAAVATTAAVAATLEVTMLGELGNYDKVHFTFKSNTKCEFKYTKNLRRTKYLFAIDQSSQIRIPRNQ